MSCMLLCVGAAQTGMIMPHLRASIPRSVSFMPPARAAKIGLAYDIYAEVPVEETKFAGTENEALEAIFLLHADGPVLKLLRCMWPARTWPRSIRRSPH